MYEVKVIEDIFYSLDDWREERGLQQTVGNIAANIGEEIVEYLRAENDEQRIDALCDIFTFGVNGIFAQGFYFNHEFFLRETVGDGFIMAMYSYSELVACQKNIDITYTLTCIVRSARHKIEQLGYDFIIAMDETLKEIHSRTGAWNDETGKWEKFKTDEAKALWYKADYSKAKR